MAAYQQLLKHIYWNFMESSVSGIRICDLSRDNVPNAEQNGKRTGDERLDKPFETGTVNGWTAN